MSHLLRNHGQKDIRLRERGERIGDGFIDAKSLRQFGQVDFLPMFIMCYYGEDV